MSKMKNSGGKGKGNSTALARPGGSSALAAAVQKLQAMGFDEAAASAQKIEVQGNVIQNKDLLCGVDFLIYDVKRKPSEEYGGMMCIVSAMLRTKECVVFTDGSSGIMAELEGLNPTPEDPIVVRGGLKKSTYKRKMRDEDGNVVLDGKGEPKYILGANGQPLMGTTYHLSGEVDVSEIKGLNRNAVGAANGRQSLRA